MIDSRDLGGAELVLLDYLASDCMAVVFDGR